MNANAAPSEATIKLYSMQRCPSEPAAPLPFCPCLLPPAPGLKTSTGLSQAAIVGGSLTGLVFNLCMRHPWDPSRPLVDLDVALVLTPALLLGVSAGEAGSRRASLLLLL
jgi:hypothetical protein